MRGIIEVAPDVERVQGLSDESWRRGTELTAPQSGATTVIAPEGPRIIALRRLSDRWVQGMRALLELTDGWDSYGGLAPRPLAVAVAASLMEWSSSLGVPDPSVVPSPDGGIQLEWHQGGMDLEVHCRPDGFVDLFAEDQARGEQEERTVHVVGPVLERWVRRFLPPSP